jgi:amino acid adenylation domain-containing protein/FkbM family methyltransferase
MIIENVKEMFSMILHIDKSDITTGDGFFNLGGESLKLVDLLELIREEYNISLSIEPIYKNNRIQDVADLISNALKEPDNSCKLKLIDREAQAFPLSFEQKQIWLAHNFSPNKSLYNIPWIIEIIGDLNVLKLSNALEKITQEQELFRCSIKQSEYSTESIIHNYVPFNFELTDCEDRNIDERLAEVINTPFNIAIAPLYRFRLLKSERRHVLCCVFHHLIIDSHSLHLFSDMLGKRYLGTNIDDNNPSYREYVAHQNDIVSEQSSTLMSDYWKQQLNSSDPAINLQSNTIKNSTSSMSFVIDSAILKKSKSLANSKGMTLFPLLFSIFGMIISRHINQNRLFIALPISTRTRGDFANTLGLFINLLPHQHSVDDNSEFVTYLEKTADELINLYENSYTPHSSLQSLSTLSHDELNKTFNIAFTIDNEATLNLNGLDTRVIPHSYSGHKFDLTFFVIDNNDSARILIEFNPDKFSDTFITSLYNAFCYATDYATTNPHTPIYKIPLINQNSILNIEDHRSGNDATILDMLAKVVTKHPNSIAISNDENEITFSELDSKSNQFANYLKTLGINSGDNVALYMSHSIDLIICILGILKSRCAYVPIHPSTPTERICFYINQTNSKFVLFDTKTPEVKVQKLINTREFFNESHEYSCQWSLTNISSDLAYIIFTSGSTGQPKGVMVRHDNLVNLFSQTHRMFKFDENDNWLLFHSYSFDFSVWEIFGSLLNGCKLIIPDEISIKSPEHLYNLIINRNITVLNQTPSAFSVFATQAIKNAYKCKLPLKYVIFGGEAINPHTILNWLKHYPTHQTKLVNMYGITEGSIHITCQPIDVETLYKYNLGTPIGKPLPGNNIILLDNHQLEVPPGFIGAMYICGKSVANGYINDADRTSERFLKLEHKPNLVFYNTGDLAIKNSDNTYSYIGRNDSQVKIRGYRIEIKEVESALMDCTYIEDTAVFVDDRNESHKTLTAFIVPSHKTARPLLEILKSTDTNSFIKLPNELTVANINPSETVSLYQEIFIDQLYLKNGLHISNESIVFDVGANIGLFSIYLGLIYPNVSVYAFEPFENLCDCIEKNRSIYGLNLTVRRIGLSDTPGIKKFSYFENVTSMSTYNYDENEHASLIRSAINHSAQDAINTIVKEKLSHEYINCHVETISQQIDRDSLTKIDLLKIDAEGAELDILMGVNNDHWHLIKQIVVEVNNTNNKLEHILQLLTSKDYHTDYEKIDKYAGVDLYMVYATRSMQGPAITRKMPLRFSQIVSKEKIMTLIKDHVHSRLPEYMSPTQYKLISQIPRTLNGKTDYKELGRLLSNENAEIISSDSKDFDNIRVIHTVKGLWLEILGKEITSITQNFFELGGSSLLAITLANRLTEKLGCSINVLDIFNYPTILKFSKMLSKQIATLDLPPITQTVNTPFTDKIAIIGMEGLFPNANNVDVFWDNLISGNNCITKFVGNKSLTPIGGERLVPFAGIIDNIYLFDADHFNIPPSEAKILDPQQRLLLEICTLNLINSNVNLKDNTRIGVFASTDQSKYIDCTDVNELSLQDKRSANYANSRDFVATRIAYKLGLNGPALTINTACSSSLVACVQAANSLHHNECDIAIVCASSLILPEILPGYLYEPDGIMSKDGTCSPFDSNASGTVPGSAVVSVILKRHKDAIQNKDNIAATIHSYSINNDGNDKASYAAPSISGQKKCLESIYKKTDWDINALDYIETHGTGTRIGDAVELMALSETFHTKSVNKIHLGSVKANIGHAGAASGLCGLIKAALILHNREIPPQINFTKWNNLCSQAQESFAISTEPTNLASGTRYAGVSAFGIGGTNAHLLLRSEDNSQISNEKSSLDIFRNKKYYNLLPDINSGQKQHQNTLETTETPPENIIHLDFIKEFLLMVANELGIESIKLEDNFFDLGGDSLIALGVISKVLKKYNIAIHIDDFYKSRNFEVLILTILRSGKKTVPSCNILQDNGTTTLILVHPGGGSIYQYNFFKNLGFSNLKIIAIENQLLNDIDSDIDSIENMAKHYISLLGEDIFKNEFSLGGWSFGGNVAYEMAYLLQQAGHKPKEVIMFDSWAKYPKRFNDFTEFNNIWFRKLDQSYIYEDNLWKQTLWKRLKMLINYHPSISQLKIKLYKATTVDLELVIEDDERNFWGGITQNISVFNVPASHASILNVMRDTNLFNNLLDLTT